MRGRVLGLISVGLWASAASADVTFAGRVEPSVTAVFWSPPRDQFHFGGGARAAFEVLPLKYLGIETHYGYFDTSKDRTFLSLGAYHDLGLGFRVHPLPQLPTEPWLSLDGSAIDSSGKWWGALAFGLGLDFKPSRRFQLGPFFRFQRIVISGAPDIHVYSLGVSVGFRS